MNIKVVIVWAFVVVLFAGLGIFGYVNQDLLLLDDMEEYTPMQDASTQNPSETSTKICNVDLATGKSSYSFSIKENKIEKIDITYSATQDNVDAFTTATNINKAITEGQIKGVSTTLSGGSSDFVLLITVNINDYDAETLSTLNGDLLKLSMIINPISSYESYKGVLPQTGNTYICE